MPESQPDFADARPLLMDYAARLLRKIGIRPGDKALSDYVEGSFAGEERSFVALSDSRGSALVEFHPLPWDSEIYGIEMGGIGALVVESGGGKASADAGLAADAAGRLAEAGRARGLKMLVARVQLNDLIWVNALEKAGFRVMDVQCPLFLENPVAGTIQCDRRRTDVRIRDLAEGDVPEIISFGMSAFGQSHLYADPFLPAGLSDRLHEAWIRNDCSGRADFVLVAAVEGRVCGFMAGLWDDAYDKLLGAGRGHIDLIAVRDDMKGLGIGRRLTEAAVRRYAGKGAKVVTVSTQAANMPAVALYQNCGFRLTGFEITLHGWI